MYVRVAHTYNANGICGLLIAMLCVAIKIAMSRVACFFKKRGLFEKKLLLGDDFPNETSCENSVVSKIDTVRKVTSKTRYHLPRFVFSRRVK